MLCSCGRTICECEGECLCCPFTCLCQPCYDLRCLFGAYCDHCGGYVSPGACRMMPPWKRRGAYPNLGFIRTHSHEPSNASDPRAIPERSTPEGSQSSTASLRSAPASSAPEGSQSPSRESSSSDDSLQFQMDDIDFSPEAASTSTGSRSRHFQGSPNSSSNTSASSTQLEQRESPSRIRRGLYPNYGKVNLRAEESTECKMPDWTPALQQPDAAATELRESGREESIASQDVAGCSRQNARAGIPIIKESCVTGVSPSRTHAATDSNPKELLDREIQATEQNAPGRSSLNSSKRISKVETKMDDVSPEHEVDETGLQKAGSREGEMINKNIPRCSDQYKHVSKQEESSITDSASHTIQPSVKEYVSNSLPSNLHLEDVPPSSFLISPQSIRQLSTSAPSVYDSSKPTELKFSKQKQSTTISTSERSSPSKLSKFDALSISNIRPIDKSRTSSESSSSIEIIPEDLSDVARYDSFHGKPNIPSNFVESFQVSNSELKTASKQPGGTSQELPNSKLESSEKAISGKRTSTESDSFIETISSEQNDRSEDEAQTNKSPKKN